MNEIVLLLYFALPEVQLSMILFVSIIFDMTNEFLSS